MYILWMYNFVLTPAGEEEKEFRTFLIQSSFYFICIKYPLQLSLVSSELPRIPFRVFQNHSEPFRTVWSHLEPFGMLF